MVGVAWVLQRKFPVTLVNNISRVQDPLSHTQSELKSDKRHLFPPPQALTCLGFFRKVITVYFGEGPADLTMRARGQTEAQREQECNNLRMTYLSQAYEFEHRVPSWC